MSHYLLHKLAEDAAEPKPSRNTMQDASLASFGAGVGGQALGGYLADDQIVGESIGQLASVVPGTAAALGLSPEEQELENKFVKSKRSLGGALLGGVLGGLRGAHLTDKAGYSDPLARNLVIAGQAMGGSAHGMRLARGLTDINKWKKDQDAKRQ